MAGSYLDCRGEDIARGTSIYCGAGSAATFGGELCSQVMNTFGKILLFTLLALVVLHLFPLLLIPIVLVVAALLAIGTLLAGGFGALAAAGLSLLAGVLGVVLVLLAELSPVCVPLLAIYGLVKLCSRNRKVAT